MSNEERIRSELVDAELNSMCMVLLALRHGDAKNVLDAIQEAKRCEKELAQYDKEHRNA